MALLAHMRTRDDVDLLDAPTREELDRVVQHRDVYQRKQHLRQGSPCQTPRPSAVLAGLAGLPRIGAPLAALSKASVALSLDHSFSVDGDGSTPGTRKAAGTNRVNIVFERLDRTLTGLVARCVEINCNALPAIDAMLAP